MVAHGDGGSRRRRDVRRVRRRRLRVRHARSSCSSAFPRPSPSPRRSRPCSRPPSPARVSTCGPGCSTVGSPRSRWSPAFPRSIAGAALSRFVDGSLLVALSGVMLFVVGVRMAWPTNAPAAAGPAPSTHACTRRSRPAARRRARRLRRVPHRAARERRRVPAGADLRAGARPHRRAGRGHVDGGRRRPHHPHADRPHRPRPRRLGGGGRRSRWG